MKIAIDGSLENWLFQQMGNRTDVFSKKSLLLDVGAYHGDFAAACLSDSGGKLKRAILFEPNPGNLKFLSNRFSGNPAVQLEPFACDVEASERKFFCQGETYTGSLLHYETTSAAPMQEMTVRCIALDGFLKEKKLSDQVGLLKIDTQGNDLKVLQGAQELLGRGRPWIVCEQIYLPLYESQAQPHEIAQCLARHNYVMAAQFNEYYNGDGWLAWSDACFVPRESIGNVGEAFQSRPTGEGERKSRRGVGEKIRRQIQRTFRHGRD
jgi:FkbM family methyltransferase